MAENVERVERFIQFKHVTDDDLHAIAGWCSSVCVGFAGTAQQSYAERVLMPVGSMAVGLLINRTKGGPKTATYLLDRSMVDGVPDEFLGFLIALLRGQRDTILKQGKFGPADVFTLLMSFIEAELSTPNRASPTIAQIKTGPLELDDIQEYLAACFNFEKLLHLGGMSPSPADRAFYEAAADQLDHALQNRAANLYRTLRCGFLHAAATGYAFVQPQRISQRFGSSLEVRYPGATPSFMRLATSYWTLKLMNEDLRSAFQLVRAAKITLHAQLLSKLELDIASLFFPTAGPIRLPRFLRRWMQRQMLRQSGVDMDVDGFPQSPRRNG
jgi:hypothetical protein